MSVASIVSMSLILTIVIGGFIYCLSLALKKERKS